VQQAVGAVTLLGHSVKDSEGRAVVVDGDGRLDAEATARRARSACARGTALVVYRGCRPANPVGVIMMVCDGALGPAGDLHAATGRSALDSGANRRSDHAWPARPGSQLPGSGEVIARYVGCWGTTSSRCRWPTVTGWCGATAVPASLGTPFLDEALRSLSVQVLPSSGARIAESVSFYYGLTSHQTAAMKRARILRTGAGAA